MADAMVIIASTRFISVPSLNILNRFEAKIAALQMKISSRQTPSLTPNAADVSVAPSSVSHDLAQIGHKYPVAVVILIIGICVVVALWCFMVRNLWGRWSRRTLGSGKKDGAAVERLEIECPRLEEKGVLMQEAESRRGNYGGTDMK